MTPWPKALMPPRGARSGAVTFGRSGHRLRRVRRWAGICCTPCVMPAMEAGIGCGRSRTWVALLEADERGVRKSGVMSNSRWRFLEFWKFPRIYLTAVDPSAETTS